MNSKIYLFLAFSIISQAAFAQPTEEALALFPDLHSNTTTNKEEGASVSEEISVISNEETEKPVTNENVPEIPSTEELFQIEEEQDAKENNKKPEEEEKEEEPQVIFITLDDINGTLSPNRNTSFCSAAFKVANLTKKKLKSFSGTFTVGTITKEFKFNNIEKGQASGAGYMWTGLSCEKILNPPKVDVQVCQLEEISEKKCKQMVQYITMPSKK